MYLPFKNNEFLNTNLTWKLWEQQVHETVMSNTGFAKILLENKINTHSHVPCNLCCIMRKKPFLQVQLLNILIIMMFLKNTC